MPASDEDLMLRTARGDVAAFGELFDRHHRPVYAFLCRFLGDTAAAEDITQEAFWRVWQHRSTFRSGSFRSWLYVIARRAALDEAAKPHRRAEPLSDYLERLPRPEGQPMLVRDQVRAALQSLPEEQRISVIMREYEGWSYREIGEILGTSEGNARVLAHRGRQALKQLLAPLMEDAAYVEPCR